MHFHFTTTKFPYFSKIPTPIIYKKLFPPISLQVPSFGHLPPPLPARAPPGLPRLLLLLLLQIEPRPHLFRLCLGGGGGRGRGAGDIPVLPQADGDLVAAGGGRRRRRGRRRGGRGVRGLPQVRHGGGRTLGKKVGRGEWCSTTFSSKLFCKHLNFFQLCFFFFSSSAADLWSGAWPSDAQEN